MNGQKSLKVSGLVQWMALHLACAEKLKVDVFLTVDDKMEKKAKANPDKISIRVENPVIWLQEVTK